MVLLDMHYDAVNLEDVFLRLTQDAAPEDGAGGEPVSQEGTGEEEEK